MLSSSQSSRSIIEPMGPTAASAHARLCIARDDARHARARAEPVEKPWRTRSAFAGMHVVHTLPRARSSWAAACRLCARRVRAAVTAQNIAPIRVRSGLSEHAL
jgi:hypothetical protein